MAVKLVYGDIALGAAEDVAVTVADSESFSAPSLLPFGVPDVAIATLEPGGWGLSHDYKVKGAQRFALWSKAKSGDDCAFSSPPVITFDFSKQFTATGLTFRFAPASGDYCRKIRVTWYQNGAVKESGTYYPDSTAYTLENTVEAFNQIVISLEETNLPNRRAKLEYIAIGIVREFEGDELTGARFVHEIDLISDTVPINVMDASFHSGSDVEYVFQRKQPVEAYNGEQLIGVYYIEEGERTGARDYNISCQDAIGLLDLDEYSGGLWIEDTAVTTILADVIGGTFELDIDPAYANSTLRGHIEPGTKREALQQVAFALGACVDTSGTAKIRVFPAPTGEGAEIPAADTYMGGKVDTSDTVTEVTVTAYIIFDERPGNDDESIEFNGVEYRYYTETKHAYNPNVVASDHANKVKFTKCYLCNLSNAQARADDIMAYYMRRNTYKAKHLLDGQSVGDRATMHLPWGGAVGGNITKMTVSVTGLTVSDTEFLMD